MYTKKDIKRFSDDGDFLYHWEGSRWYFVDQLSDDYIYIDRGYFRPYLKEKYGLTLEEYYYLIIHGSTDAPRKECELDGCHNVLEFNTLLFPYKSRYCCKEHAQIGKGLNISKAKLDAAERGELWFQSEEGRKRVSETTRVRNLEWAEKGITVFNDTKTNIYVQKMNFLSQGDPNDLAYYYWAKTNDFGKFKLGVCTDLNTRLLASQKRLRSIHEITHGTRLEMANLEESIKLELNSKSEYFQIDRFKEIYNKIKLHLA